MAKQVTVRGDRLNLERWLAAALRRGDVVGLPGPARLVSDGQWELQVVLRSDVYARSAYGPVSTAKTSTPDAGNTRADLNRPVRPAPGTVPTTQVRALLRAGGWPVIAGTVTGAALVTAVVVAPMPMLALGGVLVVIVAVAALVRW